MRSQKKIGVVLSYLAQAVQILSGLLYTPIMLRILGQSEYGLYQLVSSVVSYLSLFSLGFTSSYVRFFARYKEKNDEDGLASLNGLFMVIFFAMSVACLVCGLIMSFNLEAIFGSGLTTSEYETVKVLFGIMVVTMALTFPNSVLQCQVTAYERFAVLQGMDLMQKILNPFLAIPLLFLGYGSIGVVTVSFFLTLLKFFVNLIYCRKSLRVRFSFRNLDISLFKEISGFTIFIFINQIVDQINWNLDKFLLGRMCGSISVAVYGVASTIYNMYTNFANAIKTVFVPQVNGLVAKGKSDDELTDLFIRVGRIQLILILLVFTGFLNFGKEFILLWAGDGYEESYYIVLVLMAPMIIPLSQCLGVEIQRAKNRHQMRTIVYSAIAVLNIIISIPLIKSFGAIGTSIGTAVAVVLGNCIFMNIYYQKKIGINIIKYWKSIVNFLPSIMLMLIIGYIINRVATDISWIVFFGKVVVYCIFCACLLWLITLNKYEKNIVLSFLSKLKLSRSRKE